jgi:hypothetical protein
MSVLHAEAPENCDDIRCLSKIDPSTIVVDFNTDELACHATSHFCVFL